MASTSIPDTAVCLGCGYSLRGLPKPVCPECGREFDPADPATFKDTGKPRSLWRTGIGSPEFWSLFAAPPPMWEIVVTAIMAAQAINLGSIPFGNASLDITGLVGILTPCLVLLVVPVVVTSYVVRSIAVRRANRPITSAAGAALRRRRWRWLVLPACIMLAASVIVYPWPLRVRFALSRRSFERTANSALNGTLKRRDYQWIGLYRVGNIHIEAGQVDFQVGDALIDPVYFSYGPAAGIPRWSTRAHPRPVRQVPGTTDWYMYVD